MTITTQIRLGREWTPAEYDMCLDELSRAIADGVHDGKPIRTNPDNVLLKTSRRVWTTTEAAQAWVDFVNSMTPPPVSAAVVIE